jgi:hypothetical protein
VETHITIQRDQLIDGIKQCSIGVILLGGQGKWHIVLAFGQSKYVLGFVVEQVESSLAEICVLSSDVFSVILAMVSNASPKLKKTYMIPQGSGALGVWIVVVLVLAWRDGIFSPSIERSSAI